MMPLVSDTAHRGESNLSGLPPNNAPHQWLLCGSAIYDIPLGINLVHTLP